jgi:hypothetical protein
VGDRERQNRAFIRKLVLLRDTEGQGETASCGQIAVKKWLLWQTSPPPEPRKHQVSHDGQDDQDNYRDY